MKRKERNIANLFEGFSLFSLLIIFLVIIAVTISTGAPLFLVILGFSPTIFTILLSIIIFEESREKQIMIWGLPLLIIGLFFYISKGQAFLSSNLDEGALAGVNFMFTFLYLILFYVFVDKISAEKDVKPERIVGSLEEKLKGINQTIGRVYNAYHGGSAHLREKIKVHPDWYNTISRYFKQKDVTKDDAKKALKKIEVRLRRLEKQEQTVFKEGMNELKNLDRDENGEDPIITVLHNNDDDPVSNYYVQAKENVKRLKKQFRR